MEETAEIINKLIVWLILALIAVLGYFYKKDQKQKDAQILKMEDRFQKFMDSQGKLNLTTAKILGKLEGLEEARKGK